AALSSPSSVPVSSASPCTAPPSLPAFPTRRSSDLTVSFSSDASGTFSSGGTCPLPATLTNSCSVTYTPAAGSEGPHHITGAYGRSEDHTAEVQSPCNIVCRLPPDNTDVRSPA